MSTFLILISAIVFLDKLRTDLSVMKVYVILKFDESNQIKLQINYKNLPDEKSIEVSQ
jgi:hypothetical protein